MFGLLIEIFVLAIFDHFKKQGPIWTRTWYWADVCKIRLRNCPKFITCWWHKYLWHTYVIWYIDRTLCLNGSYSNRWKGVQEFFGTYTLLGGKKGSRIFSCEQWTKSSLLRMPWSNFSSPMCLAPGLSPKTKIELKQTQFLPQCCTSQPQMVEDNGREEGIGI